jgi:hypothetical protein
MAELTIFPDFSAARSARTKWRVPAAPPGIAGLIAAHPGLANRQFPLL